MADHSSENRVVPTGDVPRNELGERGDMRDMTVPMAQTGETHARFEDRMLARQSAAIRQYGDEAEALDGQSAAAELAEATGAATSGQLPKVKRSESIFQKRVRKFKALKRGYYSFVLLTALYLLSFFLPILVNNKAVAIHYDGSTYFPALLDLVPGASSFYPGAQFGDEGNSGEADYTALDLKFEQEDSGNWVLMPLSPWNPFQNDFTDETQENPAPPSSRHVFGTDDVGRDVFARMVYGFNISISFALVLVFFQYIIGSIVGGRRDSPPRRMMYRASTGSESPA